MEGGFDIKNYPLLKLLLPFMAGIIIGWLCNAGVLHIAALFVVSAVVLVAGLAESVPRWLFGVGAAGAFLSIGLFVAVCDKEEHEPSWRNGKVSCEAVLLEVPYMGGVTTNVLAHVTVCDSSRLERVRNEGRVNLYFMNCVEAEGLDVGDKVRFTTEIKNPQGAGNPAEFDIVRYMRVKGITGSALLPAGEWARCGAAPLSLEMRALVLRSRIIAMYEDAGFEGDRLSLLSAFSVGERRGFSDELRDAYANAGVSHILALSGLHLGIFYMVLLFLFSFAGNGRVAVVVREIAVIILLWAFAIVAGLSPSVVRAAILFTIISVGRCLRRDSSSLNSLAFAAMCMLLFAPRLLFDVSFQLSFAAVAAVLLLTPLFERLLRVDRFGRVYRFFASLTAVSLAAQLGVLPFVWYYFGTFPVYFLFTNMFVVPFATLLMILVVALWVFAFVPLLNSCIVWLLSLSLGLMNGFVEFVASVPGASATLPRIGVCGALLAALAIALFFWGVATRRHWLWQVTVVACIGLTVLNIFATDKRDEDYILVFNNRKSAALLAVESGGGCYMLSSVPQFDFDGAWVVEPFTAREGLDAPVWLSAGDSLPSVSFDSGLVSFGGLRLQLLADDCWRGSGVQRPVDALLLCRGFLGPVEELLSVFPARCVILDGSLFEGSRKRLARECKVAGVPFVDVSVMGAVKVAAHGENFSIVSMRGK